jgi:uncharacterized protein (TIRG00374 family)
MKSKYKIMLLSLSIILLIAIVWYANPYLVFTTLMKADPLLIIAAFLVSSVSMITLVLKWKVLLKNTTFKELFPVQMLGVTISHFTPGKASEPIKAVILKAKNGSPVSETLQSVIWERIMDLVIIILLSLFAIQMVTLRSNLLLPSVLSLGILSALIVVLFVILYSRRFGFWVFKILIKLPVLKRMTKEFLEKFYSNRVGRIKLLYSFVLCLITWLLYGAVTYISFLALGVHIPFLLILGIFTLSVIVGVASFLPGGIGSTEAVMTLLLTLSGVDSAIAVTGVLISRFLSLWYNIFLGGLSFVYLSKKIDIKNILK